VHANILRSSNKKSSLVDFDNKDMVDVKKAIQKEHLHTEYENGAYDNIRIVTKEDKIAKNSETSLGFEKFVNSDKLSAK